MQLHLFAYFAFLQRVPTHIRSTLAIEQCGNRSVFLNSFRRIVIGAIQPRTVLTCVDTPKNSMLFTFHAAELNLKLRLIMTNPRFQEGTKSAPTLGDIFRGCQNHNMYNMIRFNIKYLLHKAPIAYRSLVVSRWTYGKKSTTKKKRRATTREREGHNYHVPAPV